MLVKIAFMRKKFKKGFKSETLFKSMDEYFRKYNLNQLKIQLSLKIFVSF